MKCEICGIDSGCLGNHIRVHGIAIQDYYNEYLRGSTEEGTCKYCKKPTKFINLSAGYRDYCDHTCSSKHMWEDEEYRNMMTETARETMTKNNEDWLHNPEHQAWRDEVAAGRSLRMTEQNARLWSDPEQRANLIEKARERMTKEVKANLDQAAFMRFKEESPEAILYLISTAKGIKIGVTIITDSNNKLSHFLDYKLRKYPSKVYHTYTSDIETIAKIEYEIKTRFEPLSGLNEWFDTSLFEDLLNYVNSKSIVKLN